MKEVVLEVKFMLSKKNAMVSTTVHEYDPVNRSGGQQRILYIKQLVLSDNVMFCLSL